MEAPFLLAYQGLLGQGMQNHHKELHLLKMLNALSDRENDIVYLDPVLILSTQLMLFLCCLFLIFI